MNLYVSLISSTIDYIEENINERLTLKDISRNFNISEFHFNRMFKTVTGTTLKQYILGRKLTRAYEYLISTDGSVIDTAYDFGFEYPEVFSRAFKKHFGIPPNVCRAQKPELGLVKKAAVVDREITSYQGNLALKGDFVYLDGLQFWGTYVEADVNSVKFRETLKAAGDTFLEKAQVTDGLAKDVLYTVVNCHGEDNGKYTVFYGMKSKTDNHEVSLRSRLVPKGWYAKFIYCGDMFDIRESFTDDLYRWIMVREIELNSNGIGMLSIFEKDYPETGSVQILVPVKSPV